MEGREWLPEEKEEVQKKAVQKVGQEQIHGLLFSDTLSWQSIIYDLINTEQLDPWDIDLAILSQKYLARIKNLEEENFFVSSKVLLAAALLLRMKSEILLHQDLPSLDAILYGEKKEKKYIQERIELEGEIPSLIARTPLPRYKKVTLEELMNALGKAITTENRRIKRLVIARQQEFETALSLPKQRVNLKDQIAGIYRQLKEIFSKRETRLAFSELAGKTTEEKVASFVPLLHLDNQQKIWLEQESHFEEIWILLKHLYEKQNASELARMKKEVESEIILEMKDFTPEELARAEQVEADFKDPLGMIEDKLKRDDDE
ncbi:MAG: segregation/condensation protein A [Nanoarchaeota archaeon]